MMAFDRLFCPIRSSKPSRKAAQHHTSRNKEQVVTQPDGTSKNPSLGRNLQDSQVAQVPPIRYVIKEFNAKEEDELTVYPGELVIYQYSVNDPDGRDWTHVVNLRTSHEGFQHEGFVPSEYLTTKPIKVAKCKKKMPRSDNDFTLHSRSPHHHHHHHQRTHCTGEKSCHSNNGSLGLRPSSRDCHQPQSRFEVPPHSLQGSSGCHTFQKYPDLGYYYNLHPTPPRYNHFDLNCQRFPLENHGSFVVLHNFVSREENDLCVRPADNVIVLNKDDKDWYWVQRDCDGAQGFVPSRFICAWEQVDSILSKGNSTVTMKSSNNLDFHTYINHKPQDRGSLPTDQQSSVLFSP